MYSNTKYGRLLDCGIRPHLLSTECDRRNLLLTITVSCVDKTCGMMPNSKRRRASFLWQWRYSCCFQCLTFWPVVQWKHVHRAVTSTVKQRVHVYVQLNVP